MSGIMRSIIKRAEIANRPEDGDYYDDEGFLSAASATPGVR